MADGNQLTSTVGHKRGRSSDFPEPISTLKKQRNDVDENDRNTPTRYQIFGFRQLISDPDDNKALSKAAIYVRYYYTLKRGGIARRPLDFIDTSVRPRDLIEISQENTSILFAIFFGLLPGITVRAAEDEIRTWMTKDQFVQVQEHLDANFLWVQNYVAQNEGTQKIQLPPPPFQVVGINALHNTSKNSLQQPYPQQQQGSMGTASGAQTQGLSNGARGFNTGVQPPGHPTQFTNPNHYPIQPQPPQETQPMSHLPPQVHRQQPRDLLHSLSPQEREEQFQIQLQMQRKQQVEQRQTVLLCPETQPSRPQSQVGSRRNEPASFPENSTAVHHPQLPQQDNRPEQRSTPTPQPSKAVPQKAEGQPKRRGGRQPIKVTGDGTPRQRISARSLKAPAITQRTQSDSAVAHNQNLGHNIQNISQYSQLANGQPGLNGNATGSQADNHAGVSSGPGFAVPINPPIVPQATFDSRLMHGIPDSIQRSATVSGYPTQPPRLEIPPVVHSASTSPISPIAIPTAKPTRTGNTAPYGTGINDVSVDPGSSSNEREWRHYSEQQPGAQATNPHAKNYSFVPVDPSQAQGNKTPPKNKGSSRPRAQKSAQRGATDSPVPQSVQPLAQRQEEEEEAPENHAAFGNGVYEFSVPFNSQQPPAQVQQPVNGGFAAGLPQQNGFAPYATQPASLAPPQQLQVQRPLSGATTPITPVPAPSTVPSSVAPTQQQPQAGTSASTSTSMPSIKGPVVALDSGPEFSFGSLGLATGGGGGASNDASQPVAESFDSGFLDDSTAARRAATAAFNKLFDDDLFGEFEAYTHYNPSSSGFNSENP